MTIGGHIRAVLAMHEIQLKDAKAALSAVVDKAVAGEPSVITRRGRKEAVVLSFQEYERLARVPSFGELLAAFPGEPADIPERQRKPARALREAKI
jgi:prevent-host-death family protein